VPISQNNKSNYKAPNLINMHICTYNIRTFREEEKRKEFEEEISKIKWDIIGLSETKCKGEHLIKLKNGHTLYTSGNANNNKHGVGFLIHKKLEEKVISIKGINERIAQLTLKINQRYKMKIIQVYAPRTSYEDQEVIEIYQQIENLLKDEKTYFTIIMGDFNAKIGKKEDSKETAMANFGIRDRNDRGRMLIDFALKNNLQIKNSFFYRKPHRK
jgi:exonuclease III